MSTPIHRTTADRHPGDAGCFASAGETEILGLIDLSGAAGLDGIDGESFQHPPPNSGVDGRNGGNATPSSRGAPAKSIVCRLEYQDPHHLRISGSSAGRSQPPQAVDRCVDLADPGYVFIDASGGKGGDGGRGGDGQPGSRGADGRDATRFARGTDGQDGGHGGDAGDPTDGADGGDGGDVDLHLSAQHLGLLMLVKGDLRGGDIGFAGESGTGGHGGPGGRGGSSYHWTTTSTYTDAQGNVRTRTHHHVNPGGSDGHRGRDGSPSRYHAADGRPGAAGRLRILVESESTTTQYDSPYDLELITFDVASESSVLEPDSLISLDNLVVRNCGGMPTPSNYTIRVTLEAERWLQPDGVDLILPQSLLPGQCFQFDHAGLRVRLGDQIVDSPRKRSFALKQQINPVARMESGIGRPFRQFENSQQVKFRFPVQLTAITSLNSIAVGESTRVIWGVTNISDETFDQKFLYRAVRSSVKLLGGDLDPKHLVFFDGTDRVHDLSANPLVIPVHDLGPGKTVVFETRIGIEPETAVVPYQGIAIGTDLDLQRPRSSTRHDQYRCVDFRHSFIRVAERYHRSTAARFLLVANQKTSVNDIEKWTQMADYFGSALDVWDASYYGFLDLMRDVDQDQSLLEQWRGMTIIIPNNYFQTPIGTTVAFQQLAKTQFLQAAADYDISFYIVGDSRTGGGELLQRSLIPIDDGKSASQLKTQRAFLRSVAKWNDYVRRTGQVVGGATSDAADFADVSLGAVHQFDITRRTMLFQPTAQWLQQEAYRLDRKLRRDDPLHRWVVVHRYDPGDTDTSWGFFRKRQVGSLEVRRTLDATKGSAVLFEVDSIDAIDRDFIESDANKHGMFLALRFEDKVDRFIRLVSERIFPRFQERYVDRPLSDQEVEQIGASLVNAILADIYNEQKVAREAKTWGPSGIGSLMPKLNYLAERSLNYGVTFDDLEQNQANLSLLYDLIAGIRYIANESMTIWDSAWIPTSLLKRSRAVSQHLHNRCDRIITSIFGRDLSWWDKMTKADDDYNPFGGARKKNRQGVERQIADQQIAERLQRLVQQQVPLDEFSVAAHYPGISYDPDLLPGSAGPDQRSMRVMSGEQYDQYVAAEDRATRYRYETEQAIRQKRSDLLVPLATPDTMATVTPTAIPLPSTTQP